MTVKYKRKAAGFSLIELLLVITVVAGLLVMAFVTFPKLQASNRANTETQHITLLAAGILQMYSTTKNFSTLSNDVIIKSKLVPDDLPVTGSNIANVWGGDITVGPDTNPLRYSMNYTKVPQAECTKLATSVSVNFLMLAINGTTIFDRSATGGTFVLDPSAVA